MNFSSIPFLWFLAAFLVLYGLCPAKYRRYLLLLGSAVFAALGSVVGALWLLLLTAVNFVLGFCIQRTAFRKQATAAAVALNVLALVTFKLTGFLSLGVSFYTFTFISYLVDVSRGQLVSEYDPVRFANHAFFFPKLLMGPITRYGELGAVLDKPKTGLENLQTGLERFVLGFAMKIFIADKLAILWNELVKIGFSSLTTPLAWLGAFSFSIQLFIEWQSYMLMATGIAGMLGYELPLNFNYPYLARSIGDFYRRWHITLMRWFKDYVYIPLGGSRKGMARTVVNVLFVWLLTSLWHGLGWNFLLWGMSLGLFIVIEKLWLRRLLENSRVLGHIWVLFLIPLTWVCFKINNTAELGAYFSRLFPFFGGEDIIAGSEFLRILKQFAVYLGLGILFCFPLPEKLVRRYGKTWVGAILLAALFWWAVYELNRSGNNPFMYLNF